jgi:hypothetical protein
MNKKYLVIVFCLAALAAAPLTFGIKTTASQASAQEPSPRDVGVPDHVKYSAFFHYVVELNQQAQDLERSGKDGTSLRMYVQIHAELDYEQARILNEIAAACVRELEQQDRKAIAVIEKFRAQFPGGKVPKGVTLPPPPPELRAMQNKRNEIILRARDKYRLTAGDNAFTNVNDFVESQIAPTIRPVGVEKR